ncbi:hypothetical protein QMQ05_15815 [Glutamicibacter ectropisis]|uniref:DUF2530 domain-containing protein n=1 Tax=Glutamicibacter ectropisis TaxID=3046593 RepID=A0AAU6WE21_9MICC
MKSIVAIFRGDSWRSERARLSLQYVAWAIVAVATNLILILAGWPAAPWRFLVAIFAGLLGSVIMRYLLGKAKPQPIQK